MVIALFHVPIANLVKNNQSYKNKINSVRHMMAIFETKSFLGH